MIVLVDLDGTLVDRAAAFATWARRFLAGLGAPHDDEWHLAWLLDADDDGYTPRAVVVVVTNGGTAQQSLKMRLTGLDGMVHDTVISEAAGSKKPDPAIFDVALSAAAEHGGTGPTWMVGDHPVADIAGGQARGLHTGWVSHQRTWDGTAAPDVVAATTVDVLARITSAGTPRRSLPRP